VTDEVIERALVMEYRRRRDVFAAKEAAEKLKPPRTRTKPSLLTPEKAANMDKPPSEIDLSDLGD
jgi:hypothetical protein